MRSGDWQQCPYLEFQETLVGIEPAGREVKGFCGRILGAGLTLSLVVGERVILKGNPLCDPTSGDTPGLELLQRRSQRRGAKRCHNLRATAIKEGINY